MPTQTLKPKLTETQFKEKIYRVLDAHFPGHYRRKFAGQFVAGALDLVLIWQHKVVWIELKVLPNTLTPLQKQEIIKLQIAGGVAFCLTATQDGKKFFVWDLHRINEYTDLGVLLTEVLL